MSLHSTSKLRTKTPLHRIYSAPQVFVVCGIRAEEKTLEICRQIDCPKCKLATVSPASVHNLVEDSAGRGVLAQTYLSRLMTKPTSAQSDQSLRCPHEESLGPYLPIEHTAKTRISLGMGAQAFRWFCREAAHLLGIVCI